ncbi:helix-turn-helix transcriptional regulator [Virgibacillus sp. C22-A2]|uniref:Helix-turn-helix transcriptional regulator n=1 Tax=Virgibacillus tibetensis TaxID=3042313 RepID=A0ABU6KG60_9BACI|nr:helix-turn-helix transcriptional regulator [Virgibacillus sp. C22-A2]
MRNNEEKRRMEKVNRAIEDFGGLLRDYRKENFLTLEDMAQEVGCSSSYIFRIEKNKRNPEITFRIKVLSEGMNWSTEEIYLYLKEFISKEKTGKIE